MDSAYIGNETAAPPAVAFVKDVAALYHRNLWLFWKMLLPAAVFGYFVLFLATNRATDIFNHLPHSPEQLLAHRVELLEASFLRIGGFAADWIIYSFAFAGIAVAVAELEAGRQPAVEECFTGTRERLLKFLALSLSLFAICVISLALWEVLVTFLLLRLDLRSLLANPLISMGLAFVPIWIVARFGLAIPAFVLERTSITKAFFRSDDLTDRRWKILAILLLESVGGSYVVYLLIQWLAWQAAHHGHAPAWMANLGLPLGLLIGFVLEPHMFIGFALLYVRRSSQPEPATVVNAISMS